MRIIDKLRTISTKMMTSETTSVLIIAIRLIIQMQLCVIFALALNPMNGLLLSTFTKQPKSWNMKINILENNVEAQGRMKNIHSQIFVFVVSSLIRPPFWSVHITSITSELTVVMQLLLDRITEFLPPQVFSSSLILHLVGGSISLFQQYHPASPTLII